MKHEHSVLRLCQELEVSASGYYDWQSRRVSPGPRAMEDAALSREIEQIHLDSRETYGAPRLSDLSKQAQTKFDFKYSGSSRDSQPAS